MTDLSKEKVLLDPTSERSPARREHAPRPSSLAGKTVALLDISKARGDVFLDRLETGLEARGVAVRRYRKPTFARVAPAALLREIRAECDAVVEALAD